MFRLALVQMSVCPIKTINLSRARAKIQEAAKNGAKLIMLPEFFNVAYGSPNFQEAAEIIPNTSSDGGGETTQQLAMWAKENQVYLVGGSIPEQDPKTPTKYYNTCTVYDPFGNQIAKHRKVHLFDIDIPGKATFKESDVLSAGNEFTMFKTEMGSFGLGICYDIRFPELAMMAQRRGCIAMLYPGAFTMTTGRLHWDLLLRSRAVDNQMFIAGCSPATDLEASYVAWGHSSVVDPKGAIIASCQHEETIVYADLDLTMLEQTRMEIPVTKQRRFDVYPDIASSSSTFTRNSGN